MIEITKEDANKIKNIDARITSLKDVIRQKEEKCERQEKSLKSFRRHVNQDIADEIHIQVENHYAGIKKEFKQKLIKLVAFIVLATVGCAFLASTLMAILKSISILSTFKDFLLSFLTIFVLVNVAKTYYLFKDYKTARREPYTAIYGPDINKELKNLRNEEIKLKKLKEDIVKNEELLAYLETEKRKIINFLESYLVEFQKDFALKANPNRKLDRTVTIKKEYSIDKKYLDYENLDYEQISMFEEGKIPGQISLFDDDTVRVRSYK